MFLSANNISMSCTFIVMQKLIDISGKRPEKGTRPTITSVDIGHGIGNIPIQMAYTGISAISRGIELVQSRHDVAISMKENMKRICKRTPGEIELIHGRLEDKNHRDFLCKTDLSIVNNACGVFADRSATKEGEYTPDDYVAAIFANMEPGSVMITFYPIHRQLGLSLEGAQVMRNKHNMVYDNLSLLGFYKHEAFDLNKCGEKVSTYGSSSRSTTPQRVYKYTRLHQGEQHLTSVFLCCNPFCRRAKKNEVRMATKVLDNGNMVVNRCPCGGVMATRETY
jgi:hypothetical protein